MPAIGIRAVWLHGTTDDLLQVLAPAPPGVPTTATRPAQLQPVLQELARALRAQIESRTGPSGG